MTCPDDPSTVHTCPIIILAAGASSRMRGRDKLLEQVDGMPLVRRQAQMALRVTSGPVIVALPPKPHLRHNALDGLDIQTVCVPDADEGINASLRAGFGALPKDASHAMILLADMPELTEIDLNTVLQAIELSKDSLVWRGSTQSGAPGHPIIFHAKLFDVFASLKGDTGGRDVVSLAKDRTFLIPLPGNHARLDLDTPEDWENWRRSNPNKA